MLQRRRPGRPARRDHRDHRLHGQRQDDAAQPRPAAVRRHRRHVLVDGVDVRDLDPALLSHDGRPGAAEALPVLRDGRLQPALRQARRHRRGAVGRPGDRAGARLRRGACRAGWTPDRPGRHERLRRSAPAPRDRPGPGPRPEIYLFDDSFSALDYATDAALRAALARRPPRHRRHRRAAGRTIRDADRIVVLDDGRVVGTGTHASSWDQRRPTGRSCSPSSPRRRRMSAPADSSARRSRRRPPRRRPGPGPGRPPGRWRPWPACRPRSRWTSAGPAGACCAMLRPERALMVVSCCLRRSRAWRCPSRPEDPRPRDRPDLRRRDRRRLPAGVTKDRPSTRCATQGQSTFADMLTAMNVVPGQGIDFGRSAGAGDRAGALPRRGRGRPRRGRAPARSPAPCRPCRSRCRVRARSSPS